MDLSLAALSLEPRAFPIHQILPELLSKIASYLSLRDILHLAQAVPQLRPELEHLPSARVRASLRPYFSRLADFGTALRLSRGVVAGSTALDILRPGDWKPKDLDIFCRPRATRILEAFLLREGYSKNDDPLGWYDYDNDLSVHFRRDAYMDPVDFVLTFHSTPPMCYVAHNQIVSLFPKETFAGRLRRNLCTPTERRDECVAKYVQRGYEQLKEGPTLQEHLELEPQRPFAFFPPTPGQVRFESLVDPIWRARVVFED